MNTQFVEQTGAKFLEMASSLGRMNVEALSNLAQATEKTPFGAIFAANAKFARMAHENVEAMVAPLAPKTEDSKPAPAAKKTASAKKSTPAPAPKTVEKSEPTVEAKTDSVDLIEPAVEDLLVETGSASTAPADDLTLINGIGETTMRKLNDVGVKHFADIAAMSEERFQALLSSLSIKSIRYTPAYWIEEAAKHAAK